MKRSKVNDRVTVGGQPTEEDLRNLKAEGFSAVVNVRRDGEANQPLAPTAEGKAATTAGLAYFHIPVDSSNPKRENVNALRDVIRQVKGPVYVH